MKHTRKLLLLAAAVVGAAGLATAGWTYWSANGSGSASAGVGTLNPPTNVLATSAAATGIVSVTWIPSVTGSGAVIPTGYFVERTNIATSATAYACGSSATTLVSSCSGSSADSGIDDGEYTYSVTAVHRSWTASGQPSNSVVVTNVGPLHHFDVSVPTLITAGIPFDATITAKDAGGHTVTAYTGPQTLALTGPDTAPDGEHEPSLPTSVTFSNGVGIAGITLYRAESPTLTVAQGGVISGSSGTFIVTPATGSALGVSSGTSQTAGTPFSVSVTAKDAYGNVATGYRGTVHFASSDSQAIHPDDYAFVAADSGTHSFPVTLLTAASQSITVTDVVNGSITGSQLNISVAVGSAAKLAFITQPGGTNGGSEFTTQPVVTVQDAGGNTVTTNTSAVTIAIKSGTGTADATLSGTKTINAVAGVATFTGLSIDKAGSGYTLTATGGALTPADSTTFTVAVGPAAKLAFTQQASSSIPGVAFGTQPKVTVQDAGGNTVTGDTSQVTVAITTGTGTSGATLSGTKTINAVAGVATFSGLSIDKIGNSYQLRATDATLTAADSTTFSIYGNVAGLIFSNVKVGNSAVTPTCTGTIGSTYQCTTSGGNNATVTANAGFASSSGAATIYSSQNQNLGWTATGKNPGTGTVTVLTNQTTSSTTVSAQKNGSNAARVTVTFTSWNGQTWTAVLIID
jgi:hypothetical protein